MNRRQLLVGSIIAITTGLAGCIASAQTDSDNQPDAAAANRTISVTTRDEVERRTMSRFVRQRWSATEWADQTEQLGLSEHPRLAAYVS